MFGAATGGGAPYGVLLGYPAVGVVDREVGAGTVVLAVNGSREPPAARVTEFCLAMLASASMMAELLGSTGLAGSVLSCS